jgi:hypothetical protein
VRKSGGGDAELVLDISHDQPLRMSHQQQLH